MSHRKFWKVTSKKVTTQKWRKSKYSESIVSKQCCCPTSWLCSFGIQLIVHKKWRTQITFFQLIVVERRHLKLFDYHMVEDASRALASDAKKRQTNLRIRWLNRRWFTADTMRNFWKCQISSFLFIFIWKRRRNKQNVRLTNVARASIILEGASCWTVIPPCESPSQTRRADCSFF